MAAAETKGTFHARSEDSKSFRKITFEFGGYKCRYAWVSQRGYYPEDLNKANQDSHKCFENFGKDEGVEDCAFFGVFDGHGKTGDLCSQFARDNIPPMLAKELGKGTSVEHAFKKSFVKVNEDLHKLEDCDDSMSGTTASTLSPLFCPSPPLFRLDASCRFTDMSSCFCRRSHRCHPEGDPVRRECWRFERSGKSATPGSWRTRCPPTKRPSGRTNGNAEGGGRHRCKHGSDGRFGADARELDRGRRRRRREDDTGDPPRVWLKQKMLPGCAFTRSIGDAIGETSWGSSGAGGAHQGLCEGDKYIIIASDGVWEFLSNQTVLNMVSAYKSPLRRAGGRQRTYNLAGTTCALTTHHDRDLSRGHGQVARGPRR